MSQSIVNHPIIGVSSWALHHELGEPPFYGAELGSAVPDFVPTQAKLSLLELPAELARQGFKAMHICHFHLASREEAYLTKLRDAIQSAGLTLHALLVDEGDITHPENGARDEAWIAGWIPVAAQLGAENVRVIAGKTNRQGALEHSIKVLNSMAAQAEAVGIGILIENWFDVLATPAAVRELLEGCEGKAQLLLDYGNWGGAHKYEDLAAIAPFASSCHAKANLEGLKLDEEDYRRCLKLPYPEGFQGPFILVNGGLEGIGVLRHFIQDSRGRE